MVSRIAICPSCGTRVKCQGEPGRRVLVTCPNCNNTGVVKFPEVKNHPITDENIKAFIPKEKIVRKRILAGGLSAILILFSLVYILIPMAEGNLHLLIALSNSMKPTITSGDIVVSKHVEPSEIKIGDIITYRDEYKPKNCITHRVVEILKEHGLIYFRTKGDANKKPDIRLVKSSRLVGKVVFIIPMLGYLPLFAKTPLGFTLLIILPGILIILNELFRIINNIMRNKKKIIMRDDAYE